MAPPEHDRVGALKRRRVFRLAGIYAVAAWLVVQVADATFDVLGIPAEVHRVLIFLAIGGFPAALLLGWVFERTWFAPTDPDAAGGEGQASSALALWHRVALASIAVLAVGSGAYFLLSNGAPVRTGGGQLASLVVLPFDDLSPAGDQAYFAQGMSEELNSVLARLPSIRTIGRTSAESVKRQGLGIEQIGGELGVEAVVEGSVRRSADRVRISARLLATRDAGQLWSQVYERPVGDLFRMQQQIAADVASALDLRLKAAAVEPPTTSLEAYDAYLSGRHLFGRQTPEAIAAAIEQFERAVRADPDFALAWSGLADIGTLAWTIAFTTDRSVLERAIDAAERAVLAAPDSPEALTSLGRSRWVMRDWRGAEASLREAIEINPGYAFAHQNLALVLMNLGEFQEGLAASRRSVDLEPLSPFMHVNLASSYEVARDHENALRHSRRANELEPDNPIARWISGMNLMKRGRNEEALEELVAWAGSHAPAESVAAFRTSHAEEGADGLRKQMLESGRLFGGPCGGPSGPLLNALLDNEEEALRCLEAGVEIPGAYANVYIAHHWALDALRDEPRFEQVLLDMNLRAGPEPGNGGSDTSK